MLRIHRIYRKNEKVIVIEPLNKKGKWLWIVLAVLLAAAAAVLFWGTGGNLTGADKYIRRCAERSLPVSMDGVLLDGEQSAQAARLVDALSWQKTGGVEKPQGIVLDYGEEGVTLVIGMGEKNTVIWAQTEKRMGSPRCYLAPASLWRELAAWREENLSGAAPGA
ncbi:MAG: hypothetical protein PHD67_02700 [Oscillospiraceae bacterium]|nr:hypothetical protein [Oscillospiraceae bacterium]